MNTTLWIVASSLAVAFTIGGASQVLMSKEKYRSYGESQHWVDDFETGQIKAIGTIKIVGSLGLVLPAAFDVAPGLVALVASGLMLVMAGAVTTRFRRSEWKYMFGDLVFVSLFAFVAWGRFDLHPFG